MYIGRRIAIRESHPAKRSRRGPAISCTRYWTRGTIGRVVLSDGKLHDVSSSVIWCPNRALSSHGSRLCRFRRLGGSMMPEVASARARVEHEARRRYSRPVDRSTGLLRQTCLAGFTPAKVLIVPCAALDSSIPNGTSLVFLTNNFVLPALTIAKLYKFRWQVELCFKWIKQHLGSKRFSAPPRTRSRRKSVGRVCLCADRHRQKTPQRQSEPLRDVTDFEPTLFEKTDILQLFSDIPVQTSLSDTDNQLNLFN